jgi:DNA-binding response OmpR family regulator
MDTPPADRLLVIDDDLELCALVSRFLAEESFEVEWESDPARGVNLAISGGHALIVLDVMLPGRNGVEMDGFEVLRRIRAQSRIPVLMLTAKGDTLDRVLGLDLGADDYLAKPFEPSELAARIRAILRRSVHSLAKKRLTAREMKSCSSSRSNEWPRCSIGPATGASCSPRPNTERPRTYGCSGWTEIGSPFHS